ncbi:MAG: transport-associated protein [Pedosphaera sp.]|nr:transport-associated protein [Pedosphaera sp.]
MQIDLKKIVLAAALGTAVAVTGLTGCHTQGRSTGTYIDDRMVSSRVKGALNDAPVYKYPNVDVSSFNGTVQLNGFVATPEQKAQAAQIASQVDGVKQLVNNITVQPQPGMAPTGRTNGVVYPNPSGTVTPAPGSGY